MVVIMACDDVEFQVGKAMVDLCKNGLIGGLRILNEVLDSGADPNGPLDSALHF